MPKLKKSFYFPLLIIIFFLISAFSSYTILGFADVFSNKNPSSQNENRLVKPIPTPKIESVVSVLLLGYGGAGHDGGTLSDVLMLVRIDYEMKKVTTISIPRDLWVKLPIRSDLSEHYKINMAHAIGVDDTRYGLKEPNYKGKLGGGEMAKYAVNMVTGIPVDYFVSIDFSQFAKAIDIVGGVDVNVGNTFDDYFYPVKGLENETCGFTIDEINKFHADFSGFELEKQFTCRYEHLHFEKGINHMNGQTALKFVRSRHSDQHGGDFARSIRQHELLIGAKNKLLSLGALNRPLEFVDTIGNVILTDFDFAGITNLIDLVGNPDEYEIKNINLTTDNVLVHATSSSGAYILIPKNGVDNWAGIQEFVAKNVSGN